MLKNYISLYAHKHTVCQSLIIMLACNEKQYDSKSIWFLCYSKSSISCGLSSQTILQGNRSIARVTPIPALPVNSSGYLTILHFLKTHFFSIKIYMKLIHTTALMEQPMTCLLYSSANKFCILLYSNTHTYSTLTY